MTQHEMLCQEALLQKRVKYLYFTLYILWVMQFHKCQLLLFSKVHLVIFVASSSELQFFLVESGIEVILAQTQVCSCAHFYEFSVAPQHCLVAKGGPASV